MTYQKASPTRRRLDNERDERPQPTVIRVVGGVPRTGVGSGEPTHPVQVAGGQVGGGSPAAFALASGAGHRREQPREDATAGHSFRGMKRERESRVSSATSIGSLACGATRRKDVAKRPFVAGM